MKRTRLPHSTSFPVLTLLIAILCLGVLKPARAQSTGVPTLVQHTVNTKDLQGSSRSSTNTSLPNPSTAGNCLVVTAYYSGGGSVSVADDKSNRCVPVVTSASQNGQELQMWVAPNLAAGTVKVTVSFSAGATYVSLVAAEFANIATASPVDTSASAVGNSGSAAAGTMSLSSGDLVYQVASYPSFPLNSWSSMSSPALTPVSLNNVMGLAAQYWVASGSSINPMFTVSPSNLGNGCGGAQAGNSGRLSGRPARGEDGIVLLVGCELGNARLPDQRQPGRAFLGF